MEFVSMEDIFDLSGHKYFAHTTEAGKKETLEEHSKLTEKYFLKMIQEKNLMEVFEKIANHFNFSEKSKTFYYKFIFNIISFHDFGKVNSEYQKIKMKNSEIFCFRFPGLQDSRHSLLSSAIYLSYFLGEESMKGFQEFSNKEKIFLLEILFNGAFLIAKHHSDLNNFEEFLQDENLHAIMENLESISQETGGILKQTISYDRFAMFQNFYSEGKEENMEEFTQKEIFSSFVLVRLLFSLLVASDYYATCEFMKGSSTEYFGDMEDILSFQNIYEENKMIQNIREKKEEYLNKKDPEDFKDINDYRSKIFLETEDILKENIDKNIFFLEAPTGSGKSNTALNLGFKLLSKTRRKIYYIYPFNTLVEQNKNTLEDLFQHSEVLEKIRIVNSITPMDNSEEDEFKDYDKILLDRQFLHYPFVISTHISLFDILIGNSKGNIMPFYQLAHSVIVFDEIQAYRSDIWTEIMMILEEYSEILDIKIIMMSATLPDLSLLTGNNEVVRLMEDRDSYFEAPIFKERVRLNFQLLEEKTQDLNSLLSHIIDHSLEGNKIFIEFISKKEAKIFFELCEKDGTKEKLSREIFLLTGEDNRARRKKVLSAIQKGEDKVLLIATQLIEAGVDIDMDIGYKDISGIDNEEQFLGRINRSCKRKGRAYFFNVKEAAVIYKKNIAIENELDLRDLDMRKCLENKNFSEYYQKIMDIIKRNNKNLGEKGIQNFKESVWEKEFIKIQERVRLIQDEIRKNSYFFNRTIEVEERFLVGSEVWRRYKEILNEKDYAKQKVLLSSIREEMSYFIYEIPSYPSKNLLDFNDRIGELFYIEDGEKYFKKDVLTLEEKEELFL